MRGVRIWWVRSCLELTEEGVGVRIGACLFLVSPGCLVLEDTNFGWVLELF